MRHIVLKLGFSFKNLADIATLDSFKKGLDTHISECQKLVQLYEKEHSIYANNVRAVYKEAHVPEELPKKEDIKKVRMYCIKEISWLGTKI